MNKQQPRDSDNQNDQNEEGKRSPQRAEQEEAIAEASDDKNPQRDLARDRQPKPKDADKARPEEASSDTADSDDS